MSDQQFQILVKGKTLVLIDWANVYAWSRKVGWNIDIRKLYEYFISFKTVYRIRFFFGTDQHPKSKTFLEKAKNIGFEVFTKPVKYIKGERKCDFDVEITQEILLDLFENKYETLVLFSGDGDYAPVIKTLLKRKKQILIFSRWRSMGKEIFELREIQKKQKNWGTLILKNINGLKSVIESK